VTLDTVLFVLLGGLSIAMTVLGGHLASDKPGHRRAFYSMGVLSVVLLVWTGIRTQESSANLDSTLSQLKEEQKKTNQGISKIEQSTANSPSVTVNVPPAPKQRAVMALSRNTADDGIQIVHDPQYPQFGWLVNVSCKNTGATITAKKVACAEYAERIRAEAGIPNKKTLQEHWGEFSKKLGTARPQYVDLDPGRNSWGSVSLNMLDVDPDLNSGNKVIMVAGAIFYRDDAGAHKKEFCEWAQPPFNPANPTWHFCEIGHNREVF
jgi:hypothetical protein